MQKELFAQLWTNIHNIEHASIRLYESDALSNSEVLLIKNGLFLWCGITLEKASAVLNESSYAAFRGRFLSIPVTILCDSRRFSSFLSLLDEVDDIITKYISSVSSRFKAESLYKELHCCLFGWSPVLWRAVSPLFKSLLSIDLTVDSVRFLRQWSNLLSKIHINRSDLLEASFSEYYYSERMSFAETSVQKAKSRAYTDLVNQVRVELRDVISSFSMTNCIPKHGPGAVSIPKIKTRTEKYLNMGFDSRIDYMLQHSTGERMSDYSPFTLRDEDRTSRVIFVPKSWKKLRGISAEPIGLQFFQQAVLRNLMETIYSTELRFAINLEDQALSQHMAQIGSRDGRYATIDLSSASDSVTLQFVKDVFGNSLLTRWLLATRSTHTILGEDRMEIYKFAPMGSACCFPVECLLFLGIVLATATMQNRRRPLNSGCYRVYGDDIICPSSISEGVIDNLTLCGFTVNSSKSYTSGDYRESCGMDAWCGSDVTPLKIKDFSFDFNGSESPSYEHQSRIIAYLNRLYWDGYHMTRSFLLEKLLHKNFPIPGGHVKEARCHFFGDGSRGSTASCQPDNFHLTRVPLKGLQRPGYEVFGWKARNRSLPTSLVEKSLEVSYFESLLFSRRDCEGETVQYDLEFFKSKEGKALDIVESSSVQMVPTRRAHDPWVPVE